MANVELELVVPEHIASQLSIAVSEGQQPSSLEDSLVTQTTLILQDKADRYELKTRLLEILADASRQAGWRKVFGENGLLASCSRSIQQPEPENMLKQRLRFLGNCCADMDLNRDILIESDSYCEFTRLISIQSPLQPIAMVVLFNFMNDYEPAQKYCIKKGCMSDLVAVFKESYQSSSFVAEYAVKCLELLLDIDKESGDLLEDIIIFLVVFGNSSSLEFNAFQSTMNCISKLLNLEPTKLFLSRSTSLENFFELMGRLQYWEENVKVGEQSIVDVDDQQDALQFIRNCRNILIAGITDISASDSFQEIYPIESELIKLMVHWLTLNDLNLLTCAALVLGNVARSAESCKVLTTCYTIHLSLVKILEHQSQIGALHAAGGALRNILIGLPGLREDIVAAGVLAHCQKFYLASVMIEVQHMGLSLARILIANSIENVAMILKPLESESDVSPMTQILDLYEGNTELPIRTEIGRIVVSILREIAKCSDQDSKKSYLRTIIIGMCPRFVEPIIQITIQDKWPVVASEGWFAMALFARTIEGANALADIKFPKEFYELIRSIMSRSVVTLEEKSLIRTDPMTAMRGESETELGDNTEIAANRHQKDRDNIYVFLSEFLRNNTSSVYNTRKRIFEKLREGELVADEDIDQLLSTNMPRLDE